MPSVTSRILQRVTRGLPQSHTPPVSRCAPWFWLTLVCRGGEASYAEKARLEQRCSGVVQSDYIRARLFDYPLPHPKLVIPEVNRQAIYELKKIGNNLNQQTRAINEAVKIGNQPLTAEVKSYLITIEELTALLEQTRQSLTQPSVEGQRNDYQSQS